MRWIRVDHGPAAVNDARISLAVRLAFCDPLFVCSASREVSKKEADRVLRHADVAWHLPDDPEVVGVYEAEPAPATPKVDWTDWDVYVVRSDAYVVKRHARGVLLHHGLPVEQRLDALFDTLYRHASPLGCAPWPPSWEYCGSKT